MAVNKCFAGFVYADVSVTYRMSTRACAWSSSSSNIFAEQVAMSRATIRPGFPGHVLFSSPCPGVRVEFRECWFSPGFTKMLELAENIRLYALIRVNANPKYRLLTITWLSVPIYFRYKSYRVLFCHVFLTTVISRTVG